MLYKGKNKTEYAPTSYWRIPIGTWHQNIVDECWAADVTNAFPRTARTKNSSPQDFVLATDVSNAFSHTTRTSTEF